MLRQLLPGRIIVRDNFPSMRTKVPSIRIVQRNDAPVRTGGRYVLYWMIAARRTRWNHALQRAVDWAKELGKPLLVFEPLRSNYPYASARFHRFVLDGMRDQRDAFQNTRVRYYPYIEPQPGADRGLLDALARDSCLVVTDDYPGRYLRGFVEGAAAKLPVRLEAIDSNGIAPLRGFNRKFVRAFDYRRHAENVREEHLGDSPRRDPLARVELPAPPPLASALLARWPKVSDDLLDHKQGLEDLPIDHSVAPTDLIGGSRAGKSCLDSFVKERLNRYADARNRPGTTSGLSPYLHFGHVSAHEVHTAASKALDVESKTAFIDQLLTWRELSFHYAHHHPNHDRYSSLPEWARRTMEEHAADERPYRYSKRNFEQSATHDDLWNAIQRQLRREGRIENYLRMLWGKKILHWSASPKRAFEIMVELNDKYALDGRDPNSYSGIGWVLGRFDRAWGPERPVFGKIRYMTGRNTRKKIDLADYIERYGDSPQPALWEN